MADDSNVLRMQPNGPSVVRGHISIVTPAGVRAMKTVVLCRCGHSADKPFCDGVHVRIGFTDPARLPAAVDEVPAASGGLTITPMRNGPNRCDGPLTVCDVEGREVTVASILLCRCGGSGTKPFCDGTHQRNGFRS